MEDFAKKLRKAIGNADMSQKEFAEKIGVKKQQISKWTTGMAVPRSETIEKIAQTLGVPVSYFVGEDNSVSQQELAEATGLKQANIARLENGGCVPRLDTLLQLGKALGYTLRWEKEA